MQRQPPRSTLSSSSAASDVYKRQEYMGMVELKKENLELRSQIESLRVQLNLKIEDEEELRKLRENYNPDRLYELEQLLREYENKIALLTTEIQHLKEQQQQPTSSPKSDDILTLENKLAELATEIERLRQEDQFKTRQLIDNAQKMQIYYLNQEKVIWMEKQIAELEFENDELKKQVIGDLKESKDSTTWNNK
eukprot:TRINITY_DN1737_c0_g1_i2.p2 TRINITY_DN1737_c0_g1~~TRINITY_DN1737_c0_g1_i2.p2  ORF type:complete len:194 (-),score=50.81 TRINITY_DN1737_c0_g1_i2:44-625(-)